MTIKTIRQTERISILHVCVLLFWGSLFLGIILHDRVMGDASWWMVNVSMSDDLELLQTSEFRTSMWKQLLLLRGVPWLFLQSTLFFSWGYRCFCGWYVWLGLSGGMLLGTFAGRGGWSGIGQMMLYGFPQMFFYGIAYMGLLIELAAWKEMWRRRKRAKTLHLETDRREAARFVVLLLCNIGLYLTGMWMELTVNPWMLTHQMQDTFR